MGFRHVVPTAAVLAGLLTPSVAGAVGLADPVGGRPVAPTHVLDVRSAARTQAAATPARAGGRRASSRTRSARAALRRSLGSQGVVSLDPVTGTPRELLRLDGALTDPRSGDRSAIALGWVREHQSALGLTSADVDGLALSERLATTTGGVALRYAQQIGGIPSFDSGVDVAVDRAGRIVRVGGAPQPQLHVASTVPGVGAAQALRALRASAGVSGDPATVSGPDGARRVTRFAGGDLARLVLFTGTGGDAKLAWHVVTQAGRAGLVDGVVDAQSGRLLYRQSQTKYAINADVFPNYPGAPGPANARVTVDLEGALGLAPAATTLSGTYSHTFTDELDDNTIAPGDEITPGQYTFTDYPVPANGCTTTVLCTWNHASLPTTLTNRNANSVDAYYLVSRFHNHLTSPSIAFSDASGNFEVGGTGGDDPVLTQTFDGARTNGTGDGPDAAHVNNANMSTPIDGAPPTMQLFLNSHATATATSAFSDTDNAVDAATVWHEYTHGLSNRLVTNLDGSGALSGVHGGALGEAWSDWYAFDLLARDGLTPDTSAPGELDLGTYSDAVPHSTRFSAIDCPVDASVPQCPGGIDTGTGGFTFGDFGHVANGPEVHSDGEIWAQTLWDLRTSLVARFGSETAGSDAAETLITDAMRLSSPEPSFLEMRNSILIADIADNGGALRSLIWKVFARRGMGYLAAAVDGFDPTTVEDFSVPPAASVPTSTIAGVVSDAQTGLPLSGVDVGIPGHFTGDGTDGPFSTTTSAGGAYAISGVPAATYPELAFAATGGYDGENAVNVVVDDSAVVTRDRALRRDWAASGGSATFTTNDDSGAPFGCGAAEAVDQTQGAGWSANNPDPASATPAAGSPRLTVTLPRAIDVSSFLIDPGNICGDGASATVKDYTLEVSSNGTTFTTVPTTPFTPAQAGQLNIITPSGATAAGVTKVRVTLINPQNEGVGFSGHDFIDMTELEVLGSFPNTLPSGTVAAADATPDFGDTVAFTAAFTDSDSAITGYDWDFDGDGTVDRTTTAPATSYSYPKSGTYAARVSAKDFRGGAGTASTSLTVAPLAGTIGSQGPAGSQGPTGPVVTVPGKPAPPALTVLTGARRKASIVATCAVACTVTTTATVSTAIAKRLGLGRTVTSSTRRLRAGTRTLTITVPSAYVSRARKRRMKTLTVTVTAVATGGSDVKKVTRRVRITL